MTSPLHALAGICREIDYSAARVRSGVVYLLVDGGEVVYVGQTLNVEQRIVWHAEQAAMPMIQKWQMKKPAPNSHCKPFDRALAFSVDQADLDSHEGALIRFFKPRFNRRAPAYLGGDNAVLVRLGLPPHIDERAANKAWMAQVYSPRPETRGPRPRPVPAARDGRARQRDRARRLWSAVDKLLARSS